MSMFKLLVSKTLSRSAVCSLAFGPGMAVLTEGALGSTPSKRPMLLAETENDLLEREDAGARREEMRRAELDAVRRDSVRRADMRAVLYFLCLVYRKSREGVERG